MSAVLAIDTAGPVVGVALWDGTRGYERTARLSRGTEEQLPGLVDQVCAESGVPLTSLRGIAVASGPGAFTGIRVGLATAAGLAAALGVRIWAASSLLPRAVHAGFGGDLLVMLDARKSRVYAAAWRNDAPLHPEGDVDPAVALSWVDRPFRVTGEGALVYRELFEGAGGIVLADADHPGTTVLARLGSQAFARGEGVEPGALRASYLRDPDAVPRPGPPQPG
jgi:tRNA threonylcarbamoyladenosine biosynthesis protein TsaB